MTAVEIIKTLDDMVTNKVSVLNSTVDKSQPFEKQTDGWKRWFNELNGLIVFAKNIDKNWHIEFVMDKQYNLQEVKIVNWKQ